ncbi:MAG: transposase [Nitrospirota bacterium]|nr:transposase [Nitrospirota bacterium]
MLKGLNLVPFGSGTFVRRVEFRVRLDFIRDPEMIERHWEGIAAYAKPENKVSLGFVEGLNNKIRVIQRRAYGLRDEEYLRLKVLTYMLKPI